MSITKMVHWIVDLKKMVFIGMALGSIIGGYVPVLFGADAFSFISILGSVIGGIIGIFVFYRIGNG